jgi:hypothetical protein
MDYRTWVTAVGAGTFQSANFSNEIPSLGFEFALYYGPRDLAELVAFSLTGLNGGLTGSQNPHPVPLRAGQGWGTLFSTAKQNIGVLSLGESANAISKGASRRCPYLREW